MMKKYNWIGAERPARFPLAVLCSMLYLLLSLSFLPCPCITQRSAFFRVYIASPTFILHSPFCVDCTLSSGFQCLKTCTSVALLCELFFGDCYSKVFFSLTIFWLELSLIFSYFLNLYDVSLSKFTLCSLWEKCNVKQEFILLTNQKDNVLTKDNGNESY